MKDTNEMEEAGKSKKNITLFLQQIHEILFHYIMLYICISMQYCIYNINYYNYLWKNYLI